MKVNYTLQEFFDKTPITQEGVAKEAKIPPTMLRQYVGGYKNVTDKKLKAIEGAINKIGKRMTKIKIK
jgi:hypothetical protein